MTKSTSHWYARYVGDYMKKTQNLSMVEHGAYTLLLDYYYSTGEPIPANAEQMYRICRAFASVEQEAVQTIITKYFYLDGEVYRNRKADEELLKRSIISEKRSEAAKSKYANAPAIDDANAPANGHTSTTTSTIKPPIPPKSNFTEDLWFIRFWEVYPTGRKGSKDKAYKAWLGAIKKADPQKIVDGALAYSKHEDATKENGKYVKGTAAWLNDERWNDYDKPKSVGTLGYKNVITYGGRRD